LELNKCTFARPNAERKLRFTWGCHLHFQAGGDDHVDKHQSAGDISTFVATVNAVNAPADKSSEGGLMVGFLKWDK
jgi:hypothetical protein